MDDLFNGIFKIVFYLLLIVLLFSIITNLFSHNLRRHETVYKDCLQSCSKKHFLGARIGVDASISSCSVNEYDRTSCIKSCNDLYLILRGKK